MDVTIIQSTDGDWVGIYVNGELKAEGHSLAEVTLLKAVGIDAKWREVDFEGANLDRCPANLSRLP